MPINIFWGKYLLIGGESPVTAIPPVEKHTPAKIIGIWSFQISAQNCYSSISDDNRRTNSWTNVYGFNSEGQCDKGHSKCSSDRLEQIATFKVISKNQSGSFICAF